MNASTLLDRNLEAGRGEKVAIRCGEAQVTYGELHERACRVGGALRELGVRRGERVLLVMDDGPGFPAAFLGAIRAGAVPVPVNPLLAAPEYSFYVEDSGAKVVLADEACREKVPSAHLVDELDGGTPELPPADTGRDDACFWLYSSGSTGRPKGVVHLQHDIEVTCETYAANVLQIREDDVTFSTTKLFHAYGLGNNLSFPYWAGASTVLLRGRAAPEAVFATIARYRPTLFFSAPTLYNALLNADDGSADLLSARHCVSAAEPLPAEVWKRWRDRFGLVILDGIGSTELLHIYCSNRLDDVVPGSSGTPVPGYEVKLIEDGREVEGAGAGDLWVRGDSCFSEYWGQPERTAELIVDGWFSTRDRYRRDADGHYWYEGRSDDMFKVNGLWVSPAEVEGRLIEHPAVVECAVVGAVSGGFTKAKAFVVARERVDPAALQEFCRERLHRYEVPQAIEFVDDLPKTLTGKIQRFKLREAAGR